MLQAFIDESSSPDPPVYAMAGFIAPAENWARFSEDWQLCVSPLASFKMNDAMTLSGEFRWWREDARDEKVGLLRAIIDEYATASIACSVRPDQLERVFAGYNIPKQLLSPYSFLLHCLMQEIARRQKKLGLNEKIDFIFDDQVMEKGKIIDGWELFKKASRAPRELIGDVPSFKNDQDIMPLQAADMNAWLVRRRIQNAILGSGPIPMPPNRRKNARTVSGIELMWTEESLCEMRDNVMRYGPSIKGSFGPWRFFGEPDSIFVEGV